MPSHAQIVPNYDKCPAMLRSYRIAISITILRSYNLILYTQLYSDKLWSKDNYRLCYVAFILCYIHTILHLCYTFYIRSFITILKLYHILSYTQQY